MLVFADWKRDIFEELRIEAENLDFGRTLLRNLKSANFGEVSYFPAMEKQLFEKVCTNKHKGKGFINYVYLRNPFASNFDKILATDEKN